MITKCESLWQKIYWQLSEESSRSGLLSKGRLSGIWVWKQAWKDSTLTGIGTEKWYHMVPIKAEQSEPEDGDKVQLKTSHLQRSPWWWDKSKASQETRCSKTQGQAKPQLQHCSDRPQWGETELKASPRWRGHMPMKALETSCSDL